MEEESKKDVFFTTEALARFVATQGGTLKRVVCHLWQNRVNKDSTVELIDNVVLEFADRPALTISCNEQSEGLDVIDFDFKATAGQMEKEFGNSIKLFALDASSTKMWESVIGKVLNAIKLTRQADHYLSDAIILDFGDERREISISPLDGLIIDYDED